MDISERSSIAAAFLNGLSPPPFMFLDRDDCYLKETCNQREFHPEDGSGFKLYNNGGGQWQGGNNGGGQWNGGNNGGGQWNGGNNGGGQWNGGNNGGGQWNGGNNGGGQWNGGNNGGGQWQGGSGNGGQWSWPGGNGGGSSGPTEPAVCSAAGQPFGLENCACDGAKAGQVAAQRGCYQVWQQCGSQTISSFSVSQQDLLAQVQQICDTFAQNACLNESAMEALADPQCSSWINRGVGTCSAQAAKSIFQVEVITTCAPLCSDCIRF